MSNMKPNGSQQFWTDENGVQYTRSSPNAPWVPVPGQVHSGSSQPVPSAPDGFGGQGPNGYYTPEHHGHPHAPNTYSQIPNNMPPPQGTGFNFPPSGPPPFRSVIDPQLLDDEDENLPPTNKLLERVARPSMKVAGARRPLSEKAKGKQKADAPVASGSGSKRKASTPLPGAPDAKKPKGRAAGAPNYSPEDIDGLLDILEVTLPLGGHAWNSASDDFNAWAEENGRPARTAKSLELKYKQLVKTSKPTGDAECPPHIDRAHYIDSLMNDKAGSRDLDDDDIVDAEDDVVEVSDSEEKPAKGSSKEGSGKDKKVVAKAEKSDGPIARRPPADRLREPTRTSRNASRDLLDTINASLDPDTRRLRNEEHSLATMQSNQIFQLTSQLRETQRQLETLRTQLMESERRSNAAERRADRAELMGFMQPSASRDRRPLRTPSPFRSPSRTRHHRQPRPRYRQDIYYGGGGHSVRWVGGSDDEWADDDGRNDSPGTRRYTSSAPVHNWGIPSPARNRSRSPRRRSPSLEIRPPSPFRSAASGLNNMLDPSSSRSSSSFNNSFEVHVTPRAGCSSGISVVVSPAPARQVQDALTVENTEEGEAHGDTTYPTRRM